MISPFYANNAHALTHLNGLTRDLNKIEKHPTYSKALATYRNAREKLLDINAWKYDSRLKDFGYALMDENGKLKFGFAGDGDYIRFKAATSDEDYSWVLIERILEVGNGDWQSFAMRLREIIPTEGGTPLRAAKHTPNTNTLIMERKGNKIIAYMHQRNVELGKQINHQNVFTRLRHLLFANSNHSNTDNQHWETLIDIIVE